MKVNVEDISSVKKKLHIEIPVEKIKAELDSAYKELKKNAKVKGFRPGKAPRSLLERMYKNDVDGDVSGRLIKESLFEAIKDTDLKIVGSPQVDPEELKGDEPFCYEATVEIAPELDDVDYKGLSLKKSLYEVQDEELETQIKLLQKNLAQREPIKEDRPVQKDDFLLLDYEGFKDDQPFEAASKTENFIMQVGQGQISEQFDENLIDMKVNESRSFEVVFPNEYKNPELANQTLRFDVTLNEIREEVLPDINDEMAKKAGNYQTIDELKDDIRKNLQSGYDKRAEQEVNEQIFKTLLEKTAFEVPDTMVEFELEGILNEAERSFEYRNVTMEDLGLTREGLTEKYRPTAEKQVRRHLILNKIVEQEKLTLSDEDVEQGFQEMADTYSQTVDLIKNYYEQNQDKLEYFKHTLLEKQAIKLIMENSQLEEVAPELEQDSAPPAD